MEYNTLKDLKTEFVENEDFEFPDEMHVAGVRYRASKASEYTMKDMIQNNYKALFAYGTPFREQAEDKDLKQFILFLWGFPPGRNAMLPYDVRALPAQKLGIPITEAASTGKVSVDQDKVLGTVTEVFISNIPNCPPIKAKVDTGADISSLHADEWTVNEGNVTFTNEDISPNKITLPVIEKQAIKSSNGDIEYRPVIELNVKVNGVPMSEVMFNLNDRGSMEYSMLVGKNILERGGFLIDPKIAEEDIDFENLEIDWELLAEEFKDEEIEMPDESISEEQVIEYIKNTRHTDAEE